MRIGNTCPTCRQVHAPKPEKPKPQIIRIVEQEHVQQQRITNEMFQKAVQLCWNKDLHLLKNIDSVAQKKAIELARMMSIRVANVANGIE
jgi:hypothetical protein